jgi:hypothetical protein
MFRNQARNVVIISVIGSFLPGIVAIILASNDEYLINAYIGFPCVLMMGSIKTNHLSFASIKTSLRNTRLAKSKEGLTMLEEKPKSNEETINGSTTTNTNNTGKKIIKKLNRRKKKTKIVKKVDQMSTVREVSNEGTVVATQLEYVHEDDDSKQHQTELITVEEELHSSSYDGKHNTFDS